MPRIVAAAPTLPGTADGVPDAAGLAGLPWLALRTFYRNEVRLTHQETGEMARIAITPVLSTDSLYALRSAALLGLGVCVGSAWVLADDIASGRQLHLAPHWQAAPLPVSLVYPYARFYPARLRQFVEVMRAAMPGVIGGEPSD